jgi:hypothetical protein
MRRMVPLGLVVVLACIGTACSWRTHFVITNSSAATLHVVYVGDIEGDPARCVLKLEQPETAEHAWSPLWTKLPASAFSFDEARCSVDLTLAPGSSVAIASAMNYTGHDLSHPMTQRLAKYRITLVGVAGELSCTGWELVRRFERRSDSLYEFDYKLPSFAAR